MTVAPFFVAIIRKEVGVREDRERERAESEQAQLVLFRIFPSENSIVFALLIVGYPRSCSALKKYIFN